MVDEGGVGFCGMVAGGRDCGGEGTTLLKIVDSRDWFTIDERKYLITASN